MARRMTLKIEDMDPNTPGFQYSKPAKSESSAPTKSENVFANLGAPRQSIYGGGSFSGMDGFNMPINMPTELIPEGMAGMNEATGGRASGASGGGMGIMDIFGPLGIVAGLIGNFINSREDRKLARKMIEKQFPSQTEAQKELQASAGRLTNPFTQAASNSRLDQARQEIAALQQSMASKTNPFMIP